MTRVTIDGDRPRLIPTLVLSLLAVISLAPLLWLVVTSFKPAAQTVSVPPQFLPESPTFEAYSAALANPVLLNSFMNSAIYSVGATLLAIGIVLPAAYAVARLPFRGKPILLISLTLASMIPGVALLLPLYYMADRTGVIDTYLVVLLVYAAQFLPQALWFSRNYIQAIPEDLEHAAMIDGCSRFQAFRHITLPLIRPGLAAIFVLGVMFVWNEYIVVAALTRSPEMQSVQVQLVNQLLNSIGISWATVCAYVTLSMLPIVIFFVWMQRWFVRGIVAGAVK